MRLFLDLDGVCYDYSSIAAKLADSPDQCMKRHPYIYAEGEPMPGAVEGVRAARALGFDVFFATKPPHDYSPAWAAKHQWVSEHFPDMTRKLIMTSDKGLLGDTNDILVDDRPHKANCANFMGTLVAYPHERPQVHVDVVGVSLARRLFGLDTVLLPREEPWIALLEFLRGPSQ